VLYLLTIPTPTPLDDLKECNEYSWEPENEKGNKNNSLF
jgi:hypothetical protein